jgi:multiple sugar transport system permease protein/putative aldouronate transport system permease protein
MSGKVWLLPVEPTLLAFETILENAQLWRGFLNSVFYTVSGTFLNIVLTIMAGYALSRKSLPGCGIFMKILTFTLLFSGGLIPGYLLIRNLGMYNTIFAMIIPYSLNTWNIILTRTYFHSNLPMELVEAAQIDGASEFKILLKVVVGISSPIIAVIGLYSAVGFWNSFFPALIFLTNVKLYPLQLILRQILVQNIIDFRMLGSQAAEIVQRRGMTDMLRYALIIFASFPLFLLYPFIQKYFVKGIMVGSLKG